ncbi:diacylglycerol/lipid kinase family protein [Hyalangium rubrum]|uniref:Diacylglycerol kinase family protein n=1 Tax=Hyalangium rubrum TaxID=3103134 RepID=A0ABU5HCE7_9BACT|nr:diacylglycerol kinase family protein [Hyalangium sp. s54d21]MDY7230784.1 diacylglycerol kinase family protein [Hyalangium sp. s54d21]
MLVQPLRSPDLRQVPTSPAAEPKVAVLLNANARKVDARVVKSLSHAVPSEDLFLSRSELDARRIVQSVLERRYPVVFTGGGDGTFMGFINEFLRQTEPRGRFAGHALPRFGVLKLGTRNALANFVNASSTRGDGILQDVVRARAGDVTGYRSMDLVMVDGQRTPFAGLGVDGKLLNDYIWVKENLGKGFFKRMMTGSGGYFSAVAFKTVPHYLTNSTWVECEVKNSATHAAYRLGPNGKPVGEPLAPGEVLFRGKLMMAGAATMPYYGYGFRMFPFAGQRRGMMHVRLGQVQAANVLANLPKLWEGRWFPEGIHDFHAKEVTIRFERPMPFQVGGDAAGYREEVKLSVAPETVELVDFQGSVN